MSELLADDHRTAWAWEKHLETEQPRYVSEESARLLISAIPAGDHVEVFAEGKILRGKKAAQDDGLRGKKGHLMARTLHRWILVHDGLGSADVLDAPAEGFFTEGSAFLHKRHIWCTHYDEAKVKLFVDDYEGDVVDRIRSGVAHEIRLLPSWGNVAEPPVVNPRSDQAPANRPDFQGLTTDWRVAEEIALNHMKGLGFHDARLTGSGRDKGVDVVHPQAVAQVKMQGVPVSAPVVQQLRGTRPDVKHHLFFSTSGYTAAAEDVAAISGVRLFRIGSMGTVTPIGDAARDLEMEASRMRQGPEGYVARYADEIRKRVQKAVTDYESVDVIRPITHKNRRSRAVTERVFDYLDAAKTRLRSAPQIGAAPLQEILDYYEHVDRLAAVFFRAIRST
jgi:hypothetical protein